MRKLLSVVLALSVAVAAFASPISSLIGFATNSDNFSLDFEEEYKTSSGGVYYSSTSQNNWSTATYRSSHAEIISEADGNTALRLTYDDDKANTNYKDNPAINIFNPATGSKFGGESGKTYKISLDYKVENTDGQKLQLYIYNCKRTSLGSSDLNFNNAAMNNPTSLTSVKLGSEITEANSKYIRVSANYTANDTDYPIIVLSTNNSANVTPYVRDNYASVLIDDISVSPIDENNFSLDFEEEYKTSSGGVYYSPTSQNNWSTATYRSSHAEIISEADGNTALRLTYDDDKNSTNYKDNPAINIFNPTTGSKFSGQSGKKYVISLRYKVENTDGQKLQLYIYNCKRTSLGSSDLNLNNTAMSNPTSLTSVKLGPEITKENSTYLNATASYTANDTDYPIIVLSTNNSTNVTPYVRDNYASVLIDDISVTEDTELAVMFYNYDGTNKEITIRTSTTFGNLVTPIRPGYVFGGWYLDAEFKNPATTDSLVSEQKAVYVKWLGDGNAVSPEAITDSVAISSTKCITSLSSTDFTNATYRTDSLFEQAASNILSNSQKWYGSFVFSSDSDVVNTTEEFTVNDIGLNVSPSDSVIFYAQIPDYESTAATYGLALSGNGISLTQNNSTIHSGSSTAADNSFEYLAWGSENWQSSSINSNGSFTLPSNFKGYIKIKFKEFSEFNAIDFNSDYTFSSICLRLNAVGKNSGQAVFGGIFYVPEAESDSTVMLVENIPYQLAKGNSVVVQPYSVYKEANTFDKCYSGTNGEINVKYIDVKSSAFWSEAPVGITSISGEATTTTGYMNTYKLNKLATVMQPSVDSFAIYVEMPEYSSDLCGLKLVDVEIRQSDTIADVSFANSIYEYMSVDSGVWKYARADADGGLNDIHSGFKGYIRFDLKQFKGFKDIIGIDFNGLYTLDTLEFGINHMGGENGPVIFGGLYSILKNSNTVFLKHNLSGEKFSAFALAGDINCDGKVSDKDINDLRCYFLGKNELNSTELLRANKVSTDGKIDIRALVKTKKMSCENITLDTETESDKIILPMDIFTADQGKNPTKYYGREAVADYSKIIEADTALNSEENAVNFANEINNNKVADFEKIGIDKMCHVSTFLYSHNNIYVSYYANPVSSAENPAYQVARLAYCPENNPEKKVILDIQIVGDDVCGYKVTGVYDTVLMTHKDQPDNLYILWTASINGKYYRLYRIFNMKTEALGEIKVNKFKVNDTANDFSSSGITMALGANGIGCKSLFTDIGIMQKQSWDSEGYCYTGAYSGNFTCIIRSKDLITWEYVAQPNEGANNTGFANSTKWENAVYYLNGKVYYFVRQWDYDEANPTQTSKYGILTYYNLATKEWATPVLVGDCQSRSDFIYYKGKLYLFYAPTDRSHIGILKVDTDDLANTDVVLQADMKGSCFYPFIQYTSDGELAMSYTVSRQHIRLSKFTMSKYS